MSNPRPTGTTDAALARDLLYAARYYLGGRRSLLVLAAAALVAGVAFNWSWLVAAGVAPLLLAVLPCVAMCALGLCMNKKTGRLRSSETTSQSIGKAASEDAAPVALAEATEFQRDRLADDPESTVAPATANTPKPQPLEERRNSNA